MGEDLLRALTHEFRNAIAPIVNAVHLLRMRGAGPEQADALSIIDRQIAAMTRILDAASDADRLARGEASLQRRPIDLAAAVAAAVREKKPLSDGRGQRVRAVSDAGSVWVEADRARVVQAIGNVLDNALRYSDEGGEIAIEIAAVGDAAEIRIRDRGRGIPADVLPHVFEAFALRPAGRAGLGLGLAIARAVCDLHGGSIRVRSDGEGRGTEVTIRLPRASGQPEAAGPRVAATGASRPPSAARRILVADDNQAVRNSFAAILREMGHDVRLAADGVQTVEVAEAWSPEFVIVDVHMPKIDGYGVARKLRARFSPDQMQLVMMSGTDLDPMTLLGAKQAGFDHCVDKTRAVKGLDALLRGETPSLHA
ncbi:MAG TPA: hybrid sensor histidine kinase/response regulator [Casimicrobiaceae bacterium]|nr:hybrid sensor histidine kinase/response regulator [Casimicrobiaceae bacterium]